MISGANLASPSGTGVPGVDVQNSLPPLEPGPVVMTRYDRAEPCRHGIEIEGAKVIEDVEQSVGSPTCSRSVAGSD